MSYYQDWIMRQIEIICTTLGHILFGHNPNTVQLEQLPQGQPSMNLLYLQLRTLMDEGKICEAENLLYDAMEEPDQSVLEAALGFYEDLNRLSDPQLENANFSRDEILSGLQEVCTVFGIQI